MNETGKPPLVVILGPTASGKSALAVELAKQFNGYIISADSRQIYRGMDIGTGKLPVEQRQGIEHFMLDIVEPDQQYTVAEYQAKVFDILNRHKGIPFVVGGTGLYISSIVENWDIPVGGIDTAKRAELDRQPLNLLTKRLKGLDPESAAAIDLHNKRRVIRAIEVAEATGQSFVSQKKKRPLPYRVLQIGLEVPRDELYRRIELRVKEMVRDGLVEEITKLRKACGDEAPGLSAIGYSEIVEHLRGGTDIDEAVELIIQHTRNYAKRQLTWFKRDNNIRWITTSNEAGALVKEFLLG